VYVGFTISLVLHLGLIGWALVSVAGTPPLKIPEIQPVEVAIITDEDLVRLKQGDRSSKNLQTRKAPEAEKSKPQKKPVRKEPPRRVVTTPPPPPPAPPVKPKSDPIADKLAKLAPPKPEQNAKPEPDPEALALKRKREAEQKAAEAKKKAEAEARKKAEAEAKKRAEQKRKAEARRKAAEKRRKEAERKKRLAEKRRREEEKKKQFDANRISALLNKLPDAARPEAGSRDALDDRKLPRGPAAGAPEGRDTRLTASQRSMIGVMMKGQTSRCWNINSGLAGADKLVVEVVVKLNPDGSIDGVPRIDNMRSDPAFRDAANSALRALKLCAPYDLPANLYKGGWDHMVVTFDPQRMF
jgi:colicin import membrane protein